jgi:alkylated DNA repair dioxygenase AlkB
MDTKEFDTEDFRFTPDFIPPEEATRQFNILLRETPWQQFKAGYGKLRPRLESWHGSEGAVYASYNHGMKPLPWTPTMLEILGLVGQKTGLSFNGVLLNLYRNEHDSVDAHSDDDPEFGINPVIPSVSLGETRRFILRNKADWSKRILNLTHGSLLVMGGRSQSEWTHEVPKEKRVCQPRINLTFRRIIESVLPPED